MIFSWLNSDGSFAFRSGYIKNSVPNLRSTNNIWKFLDAYNRDGCNFVQFSRKIRVCSEIENYIDIIGGTALVLYGYGMNQQLDLKNIQDQYIQVARKFYMQIPIVASANVINDLTKYDDLETYDFVSNVRIKFKMKCYIFKFLNSKNKGLNSIGFDYFILL